MAAVVWRVSNRHHLYVASPSGLYAQQTFFSSSLVRFSIVNFSRTLSGGFDSVFSCVRARVRRPCDYNDSISLVARPTTDRTDRIKSRPIYVDTIFSSPFFFFSVSFSTRLGGRIDFSANRRRPEEAPWTRSRWCTSTWRKHGRQISSTVLRGSLLVLSMGTYLLSLIFRYLLTVVDCVVFTSFQSFYVTDSFERNG